jgi:hypothetical protein
MWHRKATASPFRCSFCHKPKGQVVFMLRTEVNDGDPSLHS